MAVAGVDAQLVAGVDEERDVDLGTRLERGGLGAARRAVALQAGIGVLDGLGLAGTGMYTADECVDLTSLPRQIDFAAEMIVRVFRDV